TMREALGHMDVGKASADLPVPVMPVLAADSVYMAGLLALGPAPFGKDLIGYFHTKARTYGLHGDVRRARAYYDSLAITARTELRDRPDDALTRGELG